jgi:iron complex transport system permease protein
LDVLLAGEAEAAALGVDVAQVRRWALIWTATLAAAAVSLGGSAAFVGLIVPHVMRACVGVGHRQLLPVSALGGATFLVACDIVARVVPPTGELPLGVVTGIIGAPLFIMVLLRSRRMLQ